MTRSDDALLLNAISAQADRAELIMPKTLSLGPIAERLHDVFPHRSTVEIETQCRIVWQDRFLFWN
ncbi:hypothetical protein [Ochrobactrum vermis]|uniref:hypothetical protein n=1 Tax=Ochrobactrum vermis TaxID=1827297 RepID=UPI000D497DD0|nr:hypothetical protein [Ochrobactrum vermis]PQZ29432.1 hypothetical protein CQZ93_04025 [Ochrobactrum vermis]